MNVQNFIHIYIIYICNIKPVRKTVAICVSHIQNSGRRTEYPASQVVKKYIAGNELKKNSALVEQPLCSSFSQVDWKGKNEDRTLHETNVMWTHPHLT